MTWRATESAVDVRELLEEEPVAGGGKGNARAGHDGSVERDEDAESHGCCHEAGSARTGDDGKSRYRGALAGGNLRGGQYVLDGGVGRHEEQANDKQPADESDGQVALGTTYFAGDHGEIVPSVVGPQGGDQRQHESAEAANGMRQRCAEIGP